jgi:hypothetical protein
VKAGGLRQSLLPSRVLSMGCLLDRANLIGHLFPSADYTTKAKDSSLEKPMQKLAISRCA